MQRAGHTPAQSSQPMHFSMPSSYRLSTWRPWRRSALGFFGPEFFAYSLVTVRPDREPLRSFPKLTLIPPRSPISRPPRSAHVAAPLGEPPRGGAGTRRQRGSPSRRERTGAYG